MRRFGFIFAACLIASCGFRPLYSHTDTLAGDASTLDTVSIDNVAPGGASGLALQNALIDRFYHHGYPPSSAPYILKVALQETGRNIIIEKDNTTTRSQLVLNATYALYERKDQKLIDNGIIRAVGSYNVLQSQYTTLVTLNSARQAAIEELADKLTMRTALVVDTGKGAIAQLPVAKRKNQNNFMNDNSE